MYKPNKYRLSPKQERSWANGLLTETAWCYCRLKAAKQRVLLIIVIEEIERARVQLIGANLLCGSCIFV
jgi:hypothetical protein